MISKSLHIGTTSTFKNDYNVFVEYKEENGKFIITGSSTYGREIRQYIGRSFDSKEALLKFAQTKLKNILD